jgi:hypothetical protein
VIAIGWVWKNSAIHSLSSCFPSSNKKGDRPSRALLIFIKYGILIEIYLVNICWQPLADGPRDPYTNNQRTDHGQKHVANIQDFYCARTGHQQPCGDISECTDSQHHSQAGLQHLQRATTVHAHGDVF